MGKMLRSYSNFIGGLNIDTAQDNLLETELTVAENVVFDERGSLKKRNGFLPINTESFNGEVEKIISFIRNSGEEMLFFTCNNALNIFDKVSGEITLCNVQTNKIGYFIFKNRLYFVDGAQYRYFDDGEGVKITAPQNAPTITQTTGGNLAGGVHQCFYTFVDNSGLETGPSPIQTIEVTAGNKLTWTVETGPANNTSMRKLYRKSPGSTDFKLVGLLNDNTTTTFTDNIADNLMGELQKIKYAVLNPPSSAPSLVSQSSGNLSAGKHACFYTFVDYNGNESAKSPISEINISANYKIQWTVSVGPVGTTQRKLYRKSPGSGDFKLVTTINDNTTTTFVDNVVDGSLTDVFANVIDEIIKCKYFAWHPISFKVFAAGNDERPTALYFSEANNPAFFKYTSVIYPSTAEGHIIGVNLFGDAVVVSYENGHWRWTGVDPKTDATWFKVPVPHGAFTNEGIKLTANGLMMAAYGGIYVWSTALINYNVVIQPNDELVRNIAMNKVGTIFKTIVHPETICAVYDKINNRYLMAYGDEKTNSKNNKILVYDCGLGAFSIWTGLSANALCQGKDGTIYIASKNYILKLSDGYKDVDVETGEDRPINFIIKTKQYDLSFNNLDLSFIEKKIYKLFLRTKQYDVQTSSININLIIDYMDKNATNVSLGISEELKEISLDESLVWGEEWGKVWGWADLIIKAAKIKGRGHRVQVEISNNIIDEPVTFYGLAFLFKPLKPKGVNIE